ncbi:GDSL-type esterase/lipase family protein [Sinomonas halotolerans]|uniref:GDSL-type esterase/lipase family protein n=1 Tax=Sinomonas halotolerans TaxID=1644133 RepID=A0ABU9X4N3_9MICC
MASQRFGRGLAALIAALGLIFLGSSPATAAPGGYVAVGDSIAAGVGAGTVLDACGRTDAGYAALLGASPNLGCSGATTGDVLATQVPAVPRNATDVTVTVGANNVGVSSVYYACIPDPNTLACAAAVQKALSAIAAVDRQVAAVVDAVQARAKKANVVVTGYPLLLAQDPYSTLDDVVNGATLALNYEIYLGARASGAQYVDVVGAFLGHGIGSSDPWINSAGEPAPYHPNAAGYQAYAAAIAPRL